jgi:hypothetical protein
MNIVNKRIMNLFSKISFIVLLSLGLSAITLAAGNIYNTVKDNGTEMLVYPNPVLGDEFTIKTNQDIEEVIVLNILGQMVYKQKFVHENKVKIELETSDRGIYLIQVKTIDGTTTTKRILLK